MRRRLATTIFGISVVAAAVVVVFVLSYLPVPRSFDMRGVSVHDLETTCTGIHTIAGTSVSFHWWASTVVRFAAWSCAASSMVYSANGTGGFGMFESQGGVYEFGTACPPAGSPACVPANVTGNYTGPFFEW